jgi:anti-sigma factor RsiW
VTNIARPVGEDDLQAWVDGRLTAERVEVVETYLKAHPAEQARLWQYAEQTRALREALAGEDGPIPARLNVARLTASSRHRRQLRLAQLAATIIILILGGALGWTAREIGGALGWGTPTAASTIAADAIASYRTFATEILHPVEVPATQRAHLEQWLSHHLGRPMVIPDLSTFGVQLLGGRLLPSKSGPAALLMYNDAKGNRFILYVQAGLSGEVRLYHAEGNIGASLWIDEGFGCAVVGRAGRDFLDRIGDSVYKQILREARNDANSRQGHASASWSSAAYRSPRRAATNGSAPFTPVERYAASSEGDRLAFAL